nr:DNA-directed DNA polymerase [Tanacetum cinerariifolium]
CYKIKEEVRAEKSTELRSNDTEEMVNVLSSVEAANILTSGVAAASVPPAAGVSAAGVPTISGSFPTVNLIFTTASVVTPYTRRPRGITIRGAQQMRSLIIGAKDKGKQKVVESERLSKQLARDSEIDRLHAKEELKMMIEGLYRSNEMIAKHLQEYEQAKAELTIRDKLELINKLVKYQDHHAKILKYQAQQSKPLSKKEQKEFYMFVLRSHAGWKTRHFRGMTLEEIKEKIIPIWKQFEDFVPMSSKEKAKRVIRKGLKLDQGSSKRMKTSEDVFEEKLKEMMEKKVLEDNQTRRAYNSLPAPTEGYGEAIVILEILAENFEIKMNFLQDVANDAIKLMLFPYSLEGAARIWYEKEPPNSILTWDYLVNKFINQFFHPSKTTHLKNKISRFIQRFEETFGEAWDRFKEMLRACPHHGFSELTQIDTFYNGLNVQDQDSLNAAVGGNILNKTTREALKIIENKSKVRYSKSKSNVSRVNTNSRDTVSETDDRIDKLSDQISNLVEIVNKQVTNLASAKAVEKTYATYGGAHAYYDCIATDKKLSLPELTPTRMTLQLVDKTITRPKGVSEDVFVKVGKFYFPTDFMVVDFEADPRVPLILGRSFLRTGRALIDVYGEEITLRVNDESYNSKSSIPTLVFDPTISESESCKEPIVKSSSPTLTSFGENTKAKSSIEEPPKLELKELPSHLEYAFLEESDTLPVIIAKDLKDVEKEALIKEDYKPAVQSQKRVNPQIYDVIKKEVIKLLDGSMIYPIFDSLWVSPIHCVPKKGGMTIVANENNELIPTRLVIGWRVCIDYRKLNDATRKDHFMLPFIDQMLERLEGNKFYCFLDGFSGYFQIPIDPQDQEKRTFTCPYGTFAYRRMPFSLCNAPGMFQRCMMTIFHDMIEKTMEVFMDDFLVFGDSFSSCLTNLDKMLKRCEETNLMLNWEKCHFMCREGIVLGHKILKSGIEVDRVKVYVIAKLPHPTTVKGVRSFLGHAGFYLCLIQDFSKIARPMTHLLEKEIPFIFSKECVDAFNTLKKKLTEAPILVLPDWNLPFELMCDASDFAIGAVLGQRKMKHFQPILYASKMTTEA